MLSVLQRGRVLKITLISSAIYGLIYLIFTCHTYNKLLKGIHDNNRDMDSRIRADNAVRDQRLTYLELKEQLFDKRFKIVNIEEYESANTHKR